MEKTKEKGKKTKEKGKKLHDLDLPAAWLRAPWPGQQCGWRR